MSELAEIFPGDSGEPAPNGSGALADALNAGDSEIQSESGQSDEIIPDAPREEVPTEGQSDAETDSQVEESEGDDAETAEPQPEEDGDEITDEKIDQALNDKRTRKWYKNSVNYLRSKISESQTALQEYEKFGSREELERSREFYDSLFGFEEKNGQLVPKTGNFAAQIFSTDPEKAIELTNALIGAPNPFNPEQTVFEHLLAVPEVQQYLKAQFAVENDPVLEEVPENLREAYQSLSKDEKEEFKYATDTLRSSLLRHAQTTLDVQKRQQEAQTAERARMEREFETSVAAAQESNLNHVATAFAESLKQIPFASDASQNSFLQFAVQDTVFTAVTMADTPAGSRAIESLKAIGVAIPPDTSKILSKIENDSRLLETAKRQNQSRAVTHYESEIATAQKQLIARSNAISGAIAKYFGEAERTKAQAKNELLSNISPSRPTISGNGKAPNQNDDYTPRSVTEIFVDG